MVARNDVPALPRGWECPNCRRVYSPITTECGRCSTPQAGSAQSPRPVWMRPSVTTSAPLPGELAYGNRH